MATLDEIKKMRQEGKSDLEISQNLKQKGISQQEINNAFSQSQIKEAVIAPSEISGQNYQIQQAEAPLMQNQQISPPQSQDSQDFQPSLMSQQTTESPQLPEAPTPGQAYSETAMPYPQQFSQYPQEYPAQSQEYYPQDQNYDAPQDYAQQYPQYQQPPISSDTISEIADQIVSEKLSTIRKQIEKAIDSKSSIEPMLSNFEERIQRIEKIIDRLQLSILQKVGEYGSSVSDLKTELLETQKSFKAISSSPHSHHHSSPSHSNLQHHSHKPKKHSKR